MLVTMESGGGYAGMRLRASLETAELPPAQAVAAVRALTDLAGSRPAPTHRPRYRLTLHDPAGARVVEVAEPDVPPALRPLLAELLSRPRPGGAARA